MMQGIKESEQIKIYETAFEESYDGIHILDAEGNTLFINKACERIEGIGKEEAMSKNIRQLVQEGIYSESVSLIVLRTLKPATIIQNTKNGKDVLVTGTPIFREDGLIDKVVVNSRDITDLNELKRELSMKEELARKYQIELEQLRIEKQDYNNIVCKSPEMSKVLKLALTISKVDSTVLITGESGVGKGILAEFIHNQGERKDGPCIKIDCSAIPENLIESELFGYDEGAFTGASKGGKVGLVQMANQGSLLLDEIGELSYNLQSKLLRLIQEKVYYRVGGERPITADVRIIAMTNVNLEKMVEEKTFRKDLFYRLNVIPIEIPPLRDRKEDIVPLAVKFLDIYNANYRKERQISKEVFDIFINYSWPGNVRELENIIERLVIISENEYIKQNELPEEMIRRDDKSYESSSNQPDLKGRMEEYEKRILETAVLQYKQVGRIADELNLDRSTVRKKLKKYGLSE